MKDPAFLFYPNDFAAGTMLLNEHQIGCYIRLLIAQFNNGPLVIDDIKLVLGSNFGVWPKIQSKFCLEDGRYYNKRLYDEMNKRSKFTASRRSNATSQKHMLGHMEDRDENENSNSELPLWLNKESWADWISYNLEKKRKLPPTTIKFQFKKLEKLGIGNHREVINQSIEKKWTGFFPLPEQGQKQSYKQPPRWVEPSDSGELNERKRELGRQADSVASKFAVKP